jgi:hypothetical protein
LHLAEAELARELREMTISNLDGMEPRETTISNQGYHQDAMERAEEDHQQAREMITLNRGSELDAMELVGEECLQVQEATEMTTSNQVSDLNATEPGTRSTANVHMMNRMAAVEEENLVLVVAEVMVVDNQLTEKMITIAADKAMVEANLAMAAAENLVTDEMKVTDAGAVVGMVTNPSSRLDEEGMAVVDMERVGILRKDTGVDVVVVERPDTRKTHIARKHIALAVPLHKVCLLSFPCFSSIIRH